MKTKIVVLLLFILFFAGCTPKNDKSKPATRPNILLIMLDDMGYSDLACYGGEVQTPNIDRLASEGIRFTQMHNCARCCPTRASLLTGHYPHEVGLSKNGQNLSMNAATIAEVLKANGYHTGMTGNGTFRKLKLLTIKTSSYAGWHTVQIMGLLAHLKHIHAIEGSKNIGAIYGELLTILTRLALCIMRKK